MLVRYSATLRNDICKRIEDAFLVRKQPMDEFFDTATDDASVSDLVHTFDFIRVVGGGSGGGEGEPPGHGQAVRYIRVNDSLFSAEFQKAAAFYERTLCLVFLVRNGRVIPRISVQTITKVCGRRQIAKRLCAMAKDTLASAAARKQAYDCLVSFVEFYKSVSNDATGFFPPQMRPPSGLEIWDIGCLREHQERQDASRQDATRPVGRPTTTRTAAPSLLSF